MPDDGQLPASVFCTQACKQGLYIDHGLKYRDTAHWPGSINCCMPSINSNIIGLCFDIHTVAHCAAKETDGQFS